MLDVQSSSSRDSPVGGGVVAGHVPSVEVARTVTGGHPLGGRPQRAQFLKASVAMSVQPASQSNMEA
jgi:hypothetical protein